MLICLYAHHASGQLGDAQPKFHNYTVQDGLPGSETYFIHQDRTGYIWICTDRGVSRFDGYEFQNFTTAEGLTDNVVFKIFEDHKGRLWFLTYNAKLCYFEDERIKEYPFNDKILKAQVRMNHIAVKNMYVDRNDNLYISILGNGMWIIDPKGSIRKYESGEELIIRRIDDQLMWMLYKEKENPQYDLDRKFRVKAAYHSHGQVQRIPDYKTNTRLAIASGKLGNFVLMGDLLFSLSHNKEVGKFPNAVDIYHESDMLWVSTLKNGIICIPDPLHPRKSISYLPGLSVSSVFRDKEGGYWFSTLEKGIFYTPSLDILNYSVQQGLIDDEIVSIAGIRDNIYIGFQLGRWQNIKYGYRQHKKTWEYNSIIGNSDNRFYISLDGVYELGEGKIGKKLYESWVSDYYNLGSSVIFGLQTFYRNYDDGRFTIIYDHLKDQSPLHKNFYTTLMRDGNGTLWGGGLSGLVYVKNKHLTREGLKDPLFKVRVSDMAWHPEWKNVVVTRGAGIYFFEDRKILRQINTRNGLLSDLVNVLFIDAQNGIWVGTNKGLNHIVKNARGKIVITAFTVFHGLCSNEISSIYAHDGKVYVGTKGGLSVIDMKHFTRNRQSARIFVTSLATSSKKLDPRSFHKLNHKESYLKITLGNTNYRMHDAVRICEYRFNRQSEWITTDVPEITLINPLPGEYNLEVRYMNEDGTVSHISGLCTFTISEAFYNRWYFFVGLAVFIGLIAWVLFRLRLRQIQQRHRVNSKISQLEQKALQAQMNPHFIFNALNSIQSFLVYEENEKAEKYLLKFAQLIRQTLSNSREPYITIADEIDVLQKYLDLERMRFRNKFRYSIINNMKSSDMDLKIPNMLIQPFVENSVIHGFSTLDAGGEITITLTPVDDTQILCRIEDNGVGRKKAMQQSSKTHVSFGTTITEERLKAFESRHGIRFRMETIDIDNEDGTTGTIVLINLPVI